PLYSPQLTASCPYTTLFRSAAEQVEQAQRIELNAKTALTRAQLAADSLAVDGTEEQLLQQRIVSAEAELAKTRIYAPFAGRVQTDRKSTRLNSSHVKISYAV